MKGILLAGGSGTRLLPMTQVISKQLLPVYDKPMVYYPLSLLMLAGLRELLLISTAESRPLFERLLGDGSACGLCLCYAVQPQPQGIAQALLIGREFLAGEACCLVLGDNLLFGPGLERALCEASEQSVGATIFAHSVSAPQRYGVLCFDDNGEVVDIEEKPVRPRSPYAVPGIYFYDGEAPNHAATLRPSARGEYEITDLNRAYLRAGQLRVQRFDSAVHWFDAGTPQTLLDACNFVRDYRPDGEPPIGYPELLAHHHGWIDDAALASLSAASGGEYAHQLWRLAGWPES